MKKIIYMMLLVLVHTYAHADTTGKGKIIYTQGHVSSKCRTVAHKDNETGVLKHFRIDDVGASGSAATDDNVAAIVMAALLANRDTTIYYIPGETSGCGLQPRIRYITMY